MSKLQMEAHLAHIKVVDSTGRVWLDQEYLDLASEDDFSDRVRITPGHPFEPEEFVEPFQDIYNAISNSLVLFNSHGQELVDLKRVLK